MVTGVGEEPEHGLNKQAHESARSQSQRSSEKFNTGRKRSYTDANSQQPDMHHGNGMDSKPSRPPRAAKDAQTSGRGISSRPFPSSATISSYPFMNAPAPPTPPPGFPAFDPTNPMAAYAFMQTMFPQIAGMQPPLANGEGQILVNKPRCQDYDTQGYCTLGSSCPYEHGNEIIVASKEDEYDPTKANFSINGTKSGVLRASGRTQRGRRGQGSHGHIVSKRNNRAAFSDPRLPSDTKFTTVVVEQIPEEHFDDETVRNFFSQYGKVVEVTMKPYKRLALVKYDTHAAATRAWESPKAVFDNRFVKVYWYRPDLESMAIASSNAASPKSTRATTSMDIASDEAFKQRQDERQRAHEERMRVQRAMDDARQDLSRRREKMAKEREALVAKLAVAEGHETGKSTSNSTNGRQDEGKIARTTPPKIQALRDQLARMQAEAKSLGIDPDAPRDEILRHSSKPRRGFGAPMRGVFAARAGYRGHGTARGSYRGHGFVRGRDPSVRRLDNRPRSIAMSGVDFDNVKEENLRSYLTLIGPFEDIELNPQRPDSRIIVFRERWMAEKVMYGKTDIPGVGKVELSWVANPAAGRPAEDVMLGDAGEQGRRIYSDETQQPQEDNLDVAGEEDDDWGNIFTARPDRRSVYRSETEKGDFLLRAAPK